MLSQKALLVGWSNPLDFQFREEFEKQLKENTIQVAIDQHGESWRGQLQRQEFSLLIVFADNAHASVLEISQFARSLYPHMGIVVLTTKESELDVIIALEVGADYCFCISSNMRLLMSYVKILLRRRAHEQEEARSDAPKQKLVYGSLIIDADAREVSLAGEKIDFSSSEFDLLYLLASHAGNVISRQRMMEDLRGIEYNGIDRSVDLRISRLRKRLGDNVEAPTKIKTIRGKGYLFNRNAW